MRPEKVTKVGSFFTYQIKKIVCEDLTKRVELAVPK